MLQIGLDGQRKGTAWVSKGQKAAPSRQDGERVAKSTLWAFVSGRAATAEPRRLGTLACRSSRRGGCLHHGSC
jgi:hypothetical protein